MERQCYPTTVHEKNLELIAPLRGVERVLKAITQKRVTSATYMEETFAMFWALDLHVYPFTKHLYSTHMCNPCSLFTEFHRH